MKAQIVNALLGVWLMASPAILGFGNPAANNDNIVGPIIGTFAIVSIWEATRVVRLYNVPMAIWLLLAPWILGYETTAPIINDMAVGAVVLGLSFVKGTKSQKFGGGWKAVWHSDSLHAREAQKREY